MLAYTNYKPASLPDLEAIPAHWEERRMKTAYFESDVCSTTGEEEMLSVSHITGVTPRSQKNVNMFLAETNVGQKKCQPGDIVINTMWAWMAALGVSENDGIVSPSYGVYRPKGNNYNSTYLDYLLRTEVYRAEYVRNSTGINLSRMRLYPDRFLFMRFVCPPRPEQDQIVRYLDWKVSQVNRLINAKKKQIGLLQEQKRAVINTAVTKGVEGWQRKPLKYWVKNNEVALSSNTDADFSFAYLDISSIGHGYVKQEPLRYTFGEAPSRARRIVRYGDTIISTVRTYLRSVCFINQELEYCVASTGFSVLTPDSASVLPELLSFVLTSDYFIDDVIRNSIGVSYPAISDSKLASLKVAFPLTLSDQLKLYDQIRSQFFVFDKAIASIQKQITLLNEYRTRLISDVVTGKLDVRDVAVPEYEVTLEATEDETQNEDEPTDTEEE